MNYAETMKLAATNLLLPVLIVFLNGCSTSSSIQKLSESKSHFRGTPGIISEAPPGTELYRVYQQGATGFVSIQDVRQTAERRAIEFCERQGKTMRAVSEQISNPPYILGNFPRIEIVFACVNKLKNEPSPPDDLKFTRLSNLKKLLDEGILSKEEFEREKRKILDD